MAFWPPAMAMHVGLQLVRNGDRDGYSTKQESGGGRRAAGGLHRMTGSPDGGGEFVGIPGKRWSIRPGRATFPPVGRGGSGRG